MGEVNSLFDFNQAEMMAFFAVLVRFSVMIAIVPLLGDQVVPVQLKILLSLVVSMALFPALVKGGQVQPHHSVWTDSTDGIATTVGFEAVFGLVIGFVSRFAFEAISFGGSLVGSLMGFATASTYDPHQESQSQLFAQIQYAIAMLLFLALDGHHLMLKAALESYKTVGLGGVTLNGHAGFGSLFSREIIHISGEIVKFGVLIAAPIAISLFGVNVAFGVVAKALPQLNVLILSFSVSALVGLFVLFVGMPDFVNGFSSILGRTYEWIQAVMLAMVKGS